MQEIVADFVRAVGWVTLKIVTFGRYRSRGHAEVPEGAIGLAVLAGLTWAGYVLSRWSF